MAYDESDTPNDFDQWGAPYDADQAAYGYDDDDWDNLATEVRPVPLIIPGGATLVHSSVTPRVRRRFSTQFLVLVVTACVVVSALFSAGAVVAFSSGALPNPFGATARAIAQNNVSSFPYRAQPGDTFDSIAQRFGVQVSGIFELNHLTIDQDVIVGHIYLIPVDKNYGIGYTPPFPPGVNAYNIRTPQIFILSKDGFQFSAVAGYTNGPNGTCPQGWQTWGSNPALYQFINPDIPPGSSGGSHFAQRFSFHHDGVDLSTGRSGTPLYAAQAGNVIYAAWDNGGGGYTVKISHCGWVGTSYSHMVQGSLLVHVGESVKQGQEIGLQGQTGNAFGPHVHYMVWWENIPVDPVCAYPDGIDGVTLSSEGGAYNGCPPNLNHDAWP